MRARSYPHHFISDLEFDEEYEDYLEDSLDYADADDDWSYYDDYSWDEEEYGGTDYEE